MSLLSAPITLSKIAVGAALLGGDAIVEAGRKAGSTAAATAAHRHAAAAAPPPPAGSRSADSTPRSTR